VRRLKTFCIGWGFYDVGSVCDYYHVVVRVFVFWPVCIFYTKGAWEEGFGVRGSGFGGREWGAESC
jgi:hypothetical protein